MGWGRKKASTFSSAFHLVDLGLIPGIRMVGAKALTSSNTSLRLAPQRRGVNSVIVSPPFYQVRGYVGRELPGARAVWKGKGNGGWSCGGKATGAGKHGRRHLLLRPSASLDLRLLIIKPLLLFSWYQMSRSSERLEVRCDRLLGSSASYVKLLWWKLYLRSVESNPK